MSLFSLGRVRVYPVLEQTLHSQQLDELFRQDFSSLPSELSKAFPDTKLQPRPVDFVRRYASELGGLYGEPVQRKWGDALTQAQLDKLASLYESSDIDADLYDAEQRLWLQNSLGLLPIPDGIGRVKLHVLSPWQMEFKLSDPMRADSYQYWERVEIAVPQSYSEGQVVYGKAILTQTEAYFDRPAGRVPMYGNSTFHGLTRIPLILVHRFKPEPGRPLTSCNDAVRSLAIALSVDESDYSNMIRHSSFPQKVLDNADMQQQVETVSLGPDKIFSVPRSAVAESGPGPQLRILQGQMPIAELVSWRDGQIRMHCAFLGLAPDAFLKVNTAMTASARLFSAQDRVKQRKEIRPQLRRAERDLARVICEVTNLADPLPIDPRLVDCVPQFEDAVLSVDPLHDEQAFDIRAKAGLTSSAQRLAQELKIPYEQALQQVERNLKEQADLAFKYGVAPSSATVGGGNTGGPNNGGGGA